MLSRISRGLLLVATLTGLSTIVQADVKVKAFVYTEIQKSIPFEKAPWKAINKELKKQDVKKGSYSITFKPAGSPQVQLK